MASIYDRGAALAARLLAPDRFGQGRIVLLRSTPGVIDPDQPWIPVDLEWSSEVLRGAARGVDSRLVGTEVGGAVILATDKQIICAPPAMQYQAGDTLSIDGVPVHVISVERIPAAGIVSAVKFIVRG